MTATDTFLETTRRNQEAFMHLWTDGVWKFFGLLPDGDRKVPSALGAEEIVDNTFDFAEKVLAYQREFVKRMLATGKSLASDTEWLAQEVAKDTKEASDVSKDATSDMTKAATPKKS